MNRCLWILSLVLAFSQPACASTSRSEALESNDFASSSAEVDFETHILWMNTRYREALFIPEAVLRDAEVADLPLDQYSRELLELKIGFVRNPPEYYAPNPRYGPDLECRERRRIGGSEPWPTARGLVESLEPMPLVLTARVLDVVKGWRALPRGVGRVAWLAPETVFHNDGEDLPPYFAILLQSMGGETVVSNTKVCTIKDVNGLTLPSPDDLILIIGTKSRIPDPNFVKVRFEFPVEKGFVQPQTYREIRDRDPVPLSRVREFFAARQESPEGVDP
ncbi:MAG: hypothetical protein AAF481_11195 [Acidobacteriota bacterium]